MAAGISPHNDLYVKAAPGGKEGTVSLKHLAHRLVGSAWQPLPWPHAVLGPKRRKLCRHGLVRPPFLAHKPP
jgi:hypothetical protein